MAIQYSSNSTILVFMSAAACGAIAHTALAVKQVDQIVAVGQIPAGGDGSAITSLNSPFTNGLGKLGCTGVLASGERFVFSESSVIWLNANGLPTVLTGTETTCGISDAGGFIYSPSADGEDAVWTHNGLLLRGTTPAPGVPGQFATFSSRPTMTPAGVAHWIAGYSATPGGASAGRVSYRCADTTNPVSTVVLLKTGDVIGGFTIATSGLDFSYDHADNSAHYIQTLIMTGAGTNDNFIWVDGTLVMREGDPTGQGANWQTFNGVSINNSGNYVVDGDDSGAAASDAFVSYNGAIAVKEGMTIDGYTLISGSAVRWCSINNLGDVAHVWESGSGASLAGALFMGPATSLATASRRLLTIGETLDITGDNVADVTLTDFMASPAIAPGLSLSDHPFVYVEVTLTDLIGGLPYEAIVRVKMPCVADIAPPGGNTAVNVDDLLAVINSWGACAPPCRPRCVADVSPPGGNCFVNVDDLLFIINNWGLCP